MVRSLAKRGMPKPLAILIAVLMALYVVPLGALPAEAAVVGGFEIDGNQTHESAEDWEDLSSSGDGGISKLLRHMRTCSSPYCAAVSALFRPWRAP